VSEPFPRRDLYTHDRVDRTSVEPVMPHPGLDIGTFTCTERGALPIANHGQLTLEDSEALVDCRMQMLAE
jgi:hypothetical protein